MSVTISITAQQISPDPDTILAAVGHPSKTMIDERLRSLLTRAGEIFLKEAVPQGLYGEVTLGTFAEIYRGEGRNASGTPLDEILPKATRLALFAVTLGEAITRRIAMLFARREFALGSLVDAAASEAAENAAELAQEVFRAELEARGELGSLDRLLRYSPGYCGWHISGQKKLFETLGPETIGISLRESFLMEPLKSISGVIIVGPAQTHVFEDIYPFCGDCLTHACRDRIRHISRI